MAAQGAQIVAEGHVAATARQGKGRSGGRFHVRAQNQSRVDGPRQQLTQQQQHQQLVGRKEVECFLRLALTPTPTPTRAWLGLRVCLLGWF